MPEKKQNVKIDFQPFELLIFGADF